MAFVAGALDCGSPAAALPRPALLAVEVDSGIASRDMSREQKVGFDVLAKFAFPIPAAGLPDHKAAAGLQQSTPLPRP
jgi:hypothetical protein